jgi:hypothetical protein
VDEPTYPRAVVRDSDGDMWVHNHNGRDWHQHGGPGKLHWAVLNELYGPLTTDEGTERLEAQLT